MNGWILALVLVVVVVGMTAAWYQTALESKKQRDKVRAAANRVLDTADGMMVELEKALVEKQYMEQIQKRTETLYDEQRKRTRHWHKENTKLQQRLNRISNLTIGNERIWRLDEIANEFEITADIAKEEPDETDPDRETRNRALALYVRRLEWDLGEIHEAVRGATNRRGGRYDGANWKGVRP